MIHGDLLTSHHCNLANYLFENFVQPPELIIALCVYVAATSMARTGQQLYESFIASDRSEIIMIYHYAVAVINESGEILDHFT